MRIKRTPLSKGREFKRFLKKWKTGVAAARRGEEWVEKNVEDRGLHEMRLPEFPQRYGLNPKPGTYETCVQFSMGTPTLIGGHKVRRSEVKVYKNGDIVKVLELVK